MCKLSSHEDTDPSFAWPQTTLTCVNRRNPLHASSSSVCSQIGGVSLRYSHESQTYVIDGRRKTEDTKSNARNAIRSHYRWVPSNKTDEDKDSRIVAKPIQPATREYNAKWNHNRIKNLRKFARERRTQRRKQVSNTSASPNTTTSIDYSEKKKVMWDIDNVTHESDKLIGVNELIDREDEPIPRSLTPSPIPIHTSNSKDSCSDESSTYIPPPPSEQPQVHHSFSDESSLTDGSPNCITTDVSHHKRPDVKDFVRVEKISTKGIIKNEQNKKGRVTWWDERRNRHKPFLLKTDASMDDDSVSSGLMGRCSIRLPSYSDIWEAEAFSFGSNDNDIIDTSSHASQASKYFTEFWRDKNKKLKMKGGKVRKQVDGAVDKMKIMAVNLSEFVDGVNCAPTKKEKMVEYINCAPARFSRAHKEKMKREESAVTQELMDHPITEVIVIRSREDGRHYVTKTREKFL